MSIFNYLYYFLREVLSFASGPHQHGETKVEQLKAIQMRQRQYFEERYGDLDLLFKNGYNGIQFSTFIEAIEHISSNLEGDEPASLAGSISDFMERLEFDPEYSVYFLEAIFDQLKAVHFERNLISRFSDIQFPEDKNELIVGFPDKRGINFAFQKQDEGWAIRDIYLVR
jgi:hypothetical protein